MYFRVPKIDSTRILALILLLIPCVVLDKLLHIIWHAFSFYKMEGCG